MCKRLENLAWATAQIHCYCSSTSDDSKSIDSNVSKSSTKSILSVETSLQQGQGNVVLETEPKILFCDLRLSPGETKACTISISINVNSKEENSLHKFYYFRFVP